MADELPQPVPAEFPIYTTKKVGSEEFIAIRKTDTLNSNWHIVGRDGLNYGAWQTIEHFVEARRLARAVALLATPEAQQAAIGSRMIATPLSGAVRLSVRLIADG